MQNVLSRPRLGRSGIVQLPVGEIGPNPNQPRREFDEDALRSLSASIGEYGVLSPLAVRLHYGRYELIAGERRLRAAKMAGLRKVPCVVLDVDAAESGLIALVENLQREDLGFVEEARGMANLIRLYGLSQEECARPPGPQPERGREQAAPPEAAGRYPRGAGGEFAHGAPRPGPAAPRGRGRRAAPRSST